MANGPLVSIIIPTYGIPVFLDESINSVKQQTMSDWELIIVDDNNPGTEARKKTEECIFPFLEDKRIQYIQHEKNKNGAAARNTGIEVAQGKYIAFLDSDDIYVNTRLESCVSMMEKCKDADIGGVYTGCEFRRGGKKYHTETNVKTGNFLSETLACTFMFCTGSNIFMLADIVKELRFDDRFLRHQDYEFLVRYFERYDLKAIPEVLVIKNNENFNVPNYEKNIAIKKLYLEKYAYIIESFSIEIRNYIYSSQCIALANVAASSGNWSSAVKCLRKGKTYQNVPMRVAVKIVLLYVRSIMMKRT